MSNNSTKMRLFFSHLYCCVSARTLREKNIFPRLLFQWKEDEKLISRQPFRTSKTVLKLLTPSIEHYGSISKIRKMTQKLNTSLIYGVYTKKSKIVD